MTDTDRTIRVETLTGPGGRAVRYRYPASPGSAQMEDFWLLDLHASRTPFDEEGCVLIAQTFGLLPGDPGAEILRSPFFEDAAYMLALSEVWGESPSVDDPDSFDDHDGGQMGRWGYPTPGVGPAHLRLLVQELVQDRLNLFDDDETPPQGFADWTAYWDDLRARAEAWPDGEGQREPDTGHAPLFEGAPA